MKIVCYTCSHGLVPGPYSSWDEEHQNEHRWLLGLCAQQLLATHVVVPTEAFALPANDFSTDKIGWLFAEIRTHGMTPVVWVDKWLWGQEIAVIRQWLSDVYAALDRQEARPVRQEMGQQGPDRPALRGRVEERRVPSRHQVDPGAELRRLPYPEMGEAGRQPRPRRRQDRHSRRAGVWLVRLKLMKCSPLQGESAT